MIRIPPLPGFFFSGEIDICLSNFYLFSMYVYFSDAFAQVSGHSSCLAELGCSSLDSPRPVLCAHCRSWFYLWTPLDILCNFRWNRSLCRSKNILGLMFYGLLPMFGWYLLSKFRISRNSWNYCLYFVQWVPASFWSLTEPAVPNNQSIWPTYFTS